MAEPQTEEVAKTGGQVQVHFVTDDKDLELDEDKRVLLVPTGELPSLRFPLGRAHAD